MRLTQKILAFLNDAVFDLDPGQYLAIRIQYSGNGLSWLVQDGVLTTTPSGGPGVPLSIPLANYTISELARYIGSQPGYSIGYVDRSAYSSLSALVLLDASGDIAQSNGDHLYGYTNENWSYLEAVASELTQADAQIPNALQQLSTTTAQDMWLDFLGSYFGVPRMQGELDPSYSPRITAEVLRPRSNNIALEVAISAYTSQDTTVTDVIEYGPISPLYNGAITHNSAYHYSANHKPVYGLFDVQYGYDLLNGSDPTSFAQTVIGIISRYRAAGTQLRNLILVGGSALVDMLVTPTDGGELALVVSSLLTDTLITPNDPLFDMIATIAQFTDALTTPSDAETITITYNYKYDGLRKYNGIIRHVGGTTEVDNL